jgi:hypothetical protein
MFHAGVAALLRKLAREARFPASWMYLDAVADGNFNRLYNIACNSIHLQIAP